MLSQSTPETLAREGQYVSDRAIAGSGQELLKGYGNNIVIAVINSPVSTVLSGDTETVKEVMDYLQRQNLFCKLVNVDVASHSPQMDHLRSELLHALDGLHPRSAEGCPSIRRLPVPGATTLFSTLTTGWIISGNLYYFLMRSGNCWKVGIPLLLRSAHIPFCSVP